MSRKAVPGLNGIGLWNGMRAYVVALVLLCAAQVQAQVRVTGVERVATGADQAWGGVRFSPDGARLYLTPPDYRGIWEHTLATGAVRVVTTDRGSGFGFSISDDGRRLAYRRTAYDESTRARRQEVVSVNLLDGSSEVVGAGRNVAAPVFMGDRLTVRVDGGDVSAPATGAPGVAVLGIEQMKVVVIAEGERRMLAPLGEGRYVWPVLSPDRSRLAAYELVQGAFVCRLDGSDPVVLGPYRAPAWTRDGLWLICMDDRDDGRQYVGSRLVAVSRDGGAAVDLQGTDAINAMYPACSPVDDVIACVSMTGELYLVQYAEGGR